jgi:hypothetical protein
MQPQAWTVFAAIFTVGHADHPGLVRVEADHPHAGDPAFAGEFCGKLKIRCGCLDSVSTRWQTPSAITEQAYACGRMCPLCSTSIRSPLNIPAVVKAGATIMDQACTPMVRWCECKHGSTITKNESPAGQPAGPAHCRASCFACGER